VERRCERAGAAGVGEPQKVWTSAALTKIEAGTQMVRKTSSAVKADKTTNNHVANTGSSRVASISSWNPLFCTIVACVYACVCVCVWCAGESDESVRRREKTSENKQVARPTEAI
jgi:hypothetical protein